MKKIPSFTVIFFAFLRISYAEELELISLSEVKVNKVKLSQYPHRIIISENCPICDQQLKILRSCSKASTFLIFLDHADEFKGRQIIRRKEITFPSYLLPANLKTEWKYNGSTPASSINKSINLKYGIQNCAEFLKVPL